METETEKQGGKGGDVIANAILCICIEKLDLLHFGLFLCGGL